jgi:hypothetical protein
MILRRALLGAVVMTIASFPLAASPQQLSPVIGQPHLIDDFESVAAWSLHPSDGVSLKIGQGDGRGGRAMRLDFDFDRHAGYAIARREVNLDLPPNFELTFWMRADAPVNNLELKLIDATGQNVWWLNRRDFQFPAEWREISTKKRQISFAWGPLGGGEPHHIAALEIVVTAGTGGKGTVLIDDLALTALPPQSSSVVTRGSWRGAEGPGEMTIDLGSLREIGGLHIHWDPRDFARDFSVDLSRDGVEYRRVRAINGNGRTDQLLYLPDEEARFVRLTFQRSSRGQGYAINSIDVEPVDWAPTPNDFFAIVARASRPGAYPRYLAGQQPYWTVVGADGAEGEALVGEDGNVEPFKGGFSIEPFLFRDGLLATWRDVALSQSLEEGDLPIPCVTWQDRGVSLTITAAVTHNSNLLLRYRLSSESPADITLFLAVRPFQVNPSTQFLNTTGGVSQIREVAIGNDRLVVNGSERIDLLTRPAGGGVASYDQGDVVDFLSRGVTPDALHLSDTTGYASAALAWPLQLMPGIAKDIFLAVPLDGSSTPVVDVQGALTQIAAEWHEKLHRVAFDVPGAVEVARAIRTNLGYMLVHRDGAALQPGSRSYDRAWIRDGALMASTLLRLGHPEEAREFALWFAGFQFESGKVPCCVDRRGADPVPENDSHGELIFLAGELWRYTHDLSLARQLWPHVDAAARYIQKLRGQNHGTFEGLVTESISHEGYSARPVHSYWDDVFCLKGLDDAAQLAAVLGHADRQQELQKEASSFRRDFLASIRRTIDQHHLDYLPASTELGDLDPTSTSIGISPLGFLSLFPAPELKRTYDLYFASLEKPREDYTPYEMRTIGAMVRMGQRERALQLVDRFMRDRRPSAWNEWAEVVGTDPRKPVFIGDMPHAWVASDFIRSILESFAYDREDGTLVVGAGVPRAWIAGDELHVGPLATWSGALDLRMRLAAKRAEIDLSGTAHPPRLMVCSPDERPIRRARINGRRVPHRDHELFVPGLPAHIVLEY